MEDYEKEQIAELIDATVNAAITTLEKIAESKTFAPAIARITSNAYTAFIAEGFTEEQAFELVSKANIAGSALSKK